MSAGEATELTDVLDRVKTWPTTLRITLRTRSLSLSIRRKWHRHAPPQDTRVIGGGSPRLDQDRSALAR